MYIDAVGEGNLVDFFLFEVVEYCFIGKGLHD